MKKFRFRFETVLQVRKSRQQEALAALGAAQRAFQEQVDRKRELERQLSDALSRREKLGHEATQITVFWLEQEFITGNKQRIIRAEQAIFRASKVVEKALRAYLHARKQARMIEILEERDRKEFKTALVKKEQKELDELVVMRARLREEIA